MDLSKATRKIDKIVGGNVAVQYILYTDKNEEIVIRTQFYGQHKIDSEITAIAVEKTRLLSLNIVDEIAKEDAKLARLAEIKNVLDK